MAIDDNETYGLTGAQVKDLASKVKSKADLLSLALVATSGDYVDLINTPTIPAAQIQSDWSQTTTTAKDYIKNKPTIPTVNNATLTIQKNGSNVQTFTANSSTNKTANIGVPTRVSLYSGGNYQTSSCTLSQAPSNFQYLLIEIIDNDGNCTAKLVPSNATRFSNFESGYASGIYVKVAGWTISGSKITRSFSTESYNFNAPSDSVVQGVRAVYGVKGL